MRRFFIVAQAWQGPKFWGAALAVAALSCGGMSEVRAQAFSNAKAALADYATADTSPGEACDTLASYKSKDIAEIHATSIAADDKAPAHCRVTGVLKPEIAFEVSLPQSWNRRFFMIGNGGLAGEGLEDAFRVAQRNDALKAGFAFAQTNTGHDSRKEPGGTFILSNKQKAIDYAYRAVHLTATTAKAITSRYYAQPVTRAYWNSCSNGGRQGLIEAQRYPDDFNGVVAAAPWVDQTGFTIGALWTQKAVDSAHLTAAKLAYVASKVMEKCDPIDGLKDGLIDDPRACPFDAARDVPACAAGSPTASDATGSSDSTSGDGGPPPQCLTPAEADAVNRIHAGPSSQGKPLFPGFMPGSEAPVIIGPSAAPVSAWMHWIVPAEPGGRAGDFNLAENTMRYLVFDPPRADWDYRTFDFDRDPALLKAWGRKANATSTDLDRFRRRGGKLLMTYGWSDQVLQPLMGVHYYEQVTAKYGTKTPDFMRLFMVPGMTHCSGGIGTDSFDAVTAVIDWVEKGEAPDSLHAKHVANGETTRTRPLCPYPQVARYSGNGNVDDAASFSCVKPQPVAASVH